ncbi:MAG: DUF3526 domain-containing protein [Pseudomonadota bacterium]
MRGEFQREWWFFMRDRQAVMTVMAAFLLAVIAVGIGLRHVAIQHNEIAILENSTLADLNDKLADETDPGSAAYYGFRFVYDPPSELAFAARGVRDQLPWKHRLRLLALEGQIYEHDSGNPQLAQAGSIDYAFLIAVLVPLLIILMLHDLVHVERRNNRFDLLAVTAGNASTTIRWRAGVRLLALTVALVLPFVLASTWSGASALKVTWLVLTTAAYIVFWGVLVTVLARRVPTAAAAAASLLGVWVVLVLVVPLTAASIAERRIAVPEGGEILLQQREVVNRAWDLPEEETMEAFVVTHPEWADYVETGDGFEWKWYYAFQQVGDQAVADASSALRRGVRERDDTMAAAAWLSPPLLIDRFFTRLARTDISAYQRYEQCARRYHAYLRKAHYPMIFDAEPFDVGPLLALDNTKACS